MVIYNKVGEEEEPLSDALYLDQLDYDQKNDIDNSISGMLQEPDGNCLALENEDQLQILVVTNIDNFALHFHLDSSSPLLRSRLLKPCLQMISNRFASVLGTNLRNSMSYWFALSCP